VPDLLVGLAALLVGAALGWLLARARLGARSLAEREAVQGRLAAAEAVAEELRRQLAQREHDLGAVRATLDAERVLHAQADARTEAARLSLAEQQRLVEEMRERLAESFRALSADALRQSHTTFVELARETLDAQLARRQEALDRSVRPLAEALGRYEAEVRALEAVRQQAYGSLEEQLRALAAHSVELQRETGNLVTALRSPQVRGRWGEITLKRVVELAGMARHCDFVEQVVVDGDGGRLRPDLVVHLPADRVIVVDAKVPLAAYLDATAARTPEERQAALGRHAQQVRQHVTRLADKAYWEQFANTPELVVMFVPVEPAVASALDLDASLLEDGMGRRVLVATPVTLVGLLLAIAYGWRQEQIAANAAQISALGRDLYDRVRTFGTHFGDLGDKLTKATAAFNRAVGSMESRVLPAARRFRDLGAATGEEIGILEVVDTQPRELVGPEVRATLPPPDGPA
jgi:DNA recombination protein RmuC